jgi:hypothetical protein
MSTETIIKVGGIKKKGPPISLIGGEDFIGGETNTKEWV